MFSWSLKKQEVVAQSSAEAEYIVAAAAVNQARWLRKIMHDFGMQSIQPTIIFVDNKSAISMGKNPVMYGKTKTSRLNFMHS